MDGSTYWCRTRKETQQTKAKRGKETGNLNNKKRKKKDRSREDLRRLGQVMGYGKGDEHLLI
jgi:hypothetical protein